MNRTSVMALATIISLGFSNSAQAEDLYFKLVNESESGVIEFYVSPADTGDWEENLIEDGILLPNYEIDTVIEDGRSTCQYDVRLRFNDGDTVEEYDLNLCELGEFRIQASQSDTETEIEDLEDELDDIEDEIDDIEDQLDEIQNDLG